MQLEVGGDESGGEFGVGGGTGACAPDLWGDVVQFLAVFVGDDGTRGGSRVGGDDDPAVEDAADDCCAGACDFGEGKAAGV